jgi:putative nucleotidyltransferase with HDIG domain
MWFGRIFLMVGRKQETGPGTGNNSFICVLKRDKMLRLALEYLQPGMQVGREIYGEDGRVILAAGATLTEKYIDVLKKWEIMSVYIRNPIIAVPQVDEVVEEATRLKATQTVKLLFAEVAGKGIFELTSAQNETAKTIILAVLRNRYTIIHLAQIQRHANDLFSHSINVAILSTMTAITLGMRSNEHLYALALGAMLHDIGMTAIPQKVLAKRDSEQLTPEETEILQGHTALGFAILRKMEGVPLLAAHVAYQHHEKLQGQGYPRKISGNEIHELSRIVAVANAYDNLIVDRSGKPGMPPHLAYEAIVSGVNVEFDSVVAEAFLTRIALYPIGTMVTLTSGQIGVVTEVRPKMQHRPALDIITDESQRLLDAPYSINLAEKEYLTIFVKDVVTDQAALEFLRNNQTLQDIK